MEPIRAYIGETIETIGDFDFETWAKNKLNVPANNDGVPKNPSFLDKYINDAKGWFQPEQPTKEQLAKKGQDVPYDSATGINDKILTALQMYLPARILPWAYAQLVFESANFSNTLTRVDNNPGSIMYVNKPYQDATQGTFVKANGTYAAHFTDLNSFAKDFARVLSFGAKPIDATSLQDFVHRLKTNGYFGNTSEESYYNGLKQILDKSTIIDFHLPENHSILPSFKLPKFGWILAAVGGIIIINKITE